MMKTFFRELFEYSHDINTQLVELFIADMGKTSARSGKLFSHILNAHQIWNARIEPNQLPYGVWDDHPVEAWQSIEMINYSTTLQILEKFELDKVVSYNRKGVSFSRSIRDILFHIINHSTYHRGQIATDFRQNGIEPLGTDFIHYIRKSV